MGGVVQPQTGRTRKAARGTCRAPAQAKFSPRMREGGQQRSRIQAAPVYRRQAVRGPSPRNVGVPLRHPATAAVETDASMESTDEYRTICQSFTTHPSNQNKHGGGGAPAGCRSRVCEQRFSAHSLRERSAAAA